LVETGAKVMIYF